jgi:hypothetical protein
VFKDRLSAMFGNQPASGSPRPDRNSAGASRPPQKNSGANDPNNRRQSPGLDQFMSMIRDEEPMSILDLAGASQANVSFITNMGHRLYSDDIVHALDSAFGGGDFFTNQTDSSRVNQFMSQTLDFPAANFGGAIVWDTLQFMSQPLLQNTIDQLHHILRPGAALLAFFHADEKQVTIPIYSYRIVDSRTVLLASKGKRREAQFFNNRNIEKLFAKYHSVKFFLTRDHLREVLVIR